MSIDDKVKKLEEKFRLKKRERGWHMSKLDHVSHIIYDLRERGKTLRFMVDFLIEYESVKVHKSTVHRYLTKFPKVRK